MEVFEGVSFVRLLSRARAGRCVAADVDGGNVCVSRQRRTYNAVWAVEPRALPDGSPCVLLRAAYGRYLVATDDQAEIGPADGVTVLQVDLINAPPPPGFLWHAIRRRGGFLLRSVSGYYLRANGKYCHWRRFVTATPDSGSDMLLWDIQPVPPATRRPTFLHPTRELKHRGRPPLSMAEMTRTLRVVRAGADGSIDEDAWSTMIVHTKKREQVRVMITIKNMGRGPDVPGQKIPVDNTTACIRGGRYAQLSPMVLDLHRGTEQVDIVILTRGSQADNELKYPDLEAP
ncbi:hypothetical protein ACP4OV_016462 [Aristida adscensionis]